MAHEEEDSNPFDDVDDEWADVQGAGGCVPAAGGEDEDLWAEEWTKDGIQTATTTTAEQRVQSAPSTSDEGDNASPAAAAHGSSSSPASQRDQPDTKPSSAQQQQAEERQCGNTPTPDAPAPAPPAVPAAVQDVGEPQLAHPAAEPHPAEPGPKPDVAASAVSEEPLGAVEAPMVSPLEPQASAPAEDTQQQPPSTRGLAVEHEATAEQEAQQQQGSGGGSAQQPWGWSGGWSLNVLGGTLRAVAAGAVRDVRELTGSLQQALAEVHDGDSEEADEERPGDTSSTTAGQLAAQATPPASQQQPTLPVHEAEQEAAGEAAEPAVAAAALPAVSEPGVAPQQPPGPGAGDAQPQDVVISPPKVQPEADRRGAAEDDQEDGNTSGKALGLSDLDEVDQRMEQLATGAVKALSNLWGGLSGVARNTATLVSKVEAATLEMAKDLVSGSGVTHDVQQLQSAAVSGVRGVAAIGTRIEAGLETVGRTALGLLEEVTGQHRATGPAAERDAWEGGGGGSGGAPGERSAAGAGARPSAQRTFEELFNLYGGQQLSEDLENLANECARIANKARTRLEEGQQLELDKSLALLGSLFSRPLLPSTGVPAATDAEPDEDVGVDTWLAQDEAARLAYEQLEQRYEPVHFLCQDSAMRAQGFQALLLEAAREQQEEEEQQHAARRAAAAASAATAVAAVLVLPPSAAAPGTSLGEAPSEAADASAAAADNAAAAAAAAAEEAAASAALTPVGGALGEAQAGARGPEGDVSLLTAALLQVHGHALKRVAELTTAQLQLLLDHGVNLASPARTTDIPAGSSISWPELALSQARLLQRQAQRMARDMDTVEQRYAAALQATLEQVASSTAPSGQDKPSSAKDPDAPAELVVVGPTHAVASDRALEQQEQRQAASGSRGRLALDLDLCRQAVQQLRSARGMARASLEEAFRGLLYPVLVRELVQHIAGADGS